MSILTIKFNNPKEILKSVFKLFILVQLIALLYFILNPIRLGTPIVKVWGWAASAIFISTLLPGIITRFNWKGWVSEIGKTIFFARTQLGISMFFAAFLHYFLKVKSLIQTNNFPPKEVELYFVFGMLALLLSLILFLTSNQLSKKILKKNWFRLHKLTYAILFLVFLHVAVLERGLFMGIFGLMIILEIGSFVFAWKSKQNKVIS